MDREAIERIVAKYSEKVGGLMSILLEVQTKYGYLPRNVLQIVAEATGRSLVDIYSVATCHASLKLKSPRGVMEDSHIYVSEQDMKRLMALVESASGRDRELADVLDDELLRAKVVPACDLPPDVVTMNSHVQFEDEATGKQREIVLVYPKDADPRNGRISVLAPVGSALLGLSVGQSIDWLMPNGRIKRFKIVDVLYRP